MADMFRLDGRVAVVTGACGILGAVFSRALAHAGAKVLASDLGDERVKALADEISKETGVQAEGWAVDLRSEQSVRSCAGGLLSKHPSIDVIVNNAAAKSPGFFAPLKDFSLED